MVQEQQIENALTELGISISTLGALSGIQRGTISQALRGQISFSGEQISALTKIIEDLRAILQAAKPFPIDFTKCTEIQKLLDLYRTGVRFTVQFTNPAEGSKC